MDDDAADLDVDRISLDGRFVVMSDGAILPISNFYDDDGDECEPVDAVVCVAGTDAAGWYTIEIFETTGPIH